MPTVIDVDAPTTPAARAGKTTSAITSTFPSPETQRWVAQVVGPGARVVSGRRLTGGTMSSVHQLSVETSAGQRHQVVLRRLVAWRDPARASEWIRREAEVLRQIRGAGLPAPELLAADPAGSEAGGQPALLMTRLPGRIDLAPRDAESWLRQMAAVLARIHEADVAAPIEVPRNRSAGTRSRDWAIDPGVWRQALAATAGEPPDYEPRFMHGDYQHFNLLWSRDKLSGVVDWVAGAIGPADRDVGHCRLNLAVLFSAELAEQFLAAYQAEAGQTVDPWWDLSEILAYSPNWQEFIPVQVADRAPVDTSGMTARVEALIGISLKRL